MYSSSTLLVALVAAAAFEGAAFGYVADLSGNPATKVIRDAAAQTCLAQNALQTASQKTGQEPGTTGLESGQVASEIDQANFINTCSGKTLTNGLQNPNGSCNGIPMGDIPAKGNMVSTLILSPQEGQQISANQTFNVTLQLAGLNPGFFTNADTTYYTAPQKLGQNGNVNGHTHVVIQALDSQTQPPDPTTFAFFKGLNDKGNGQGELTVEVAGGLPEGKHRICTMAASENHQPPAMPVAKRGPPDDCIRITVTPAGGANKGQATKAATPTTSSGVANKDTGKGKTKDKGKAKNNDKAKETNSPVPSATPCP